MTPDDLLDESLQRELAPENEKLRARTLAMWNQDFLRECESRAGKPIKQINEALDYIEAAFDDRLLAERPLAPGYRGEVQKRIAILRRILTGAE